MPLPRLARILAPAMICALLAAGALLGSAAPAHAASPLRFGSFVADPSGPDHNTNRQLVRETIELRNTGSKSINLTGYRIKDKQNHVYAFPWGFTLKPRTSVIVHTGKGRNGSRDLYWGKTSYVWNNTGDTAYLLAPGGSRVVTSCAYQKNATGTKRC